MHDDSSRFCCGCLLLTLGILIFSFVLRYEKPFRPSILVFHLYIRPVFAILLGFSQRPCESQLSPWQFSDLSPPMTQKQPGQLSVSQKRLASASVAFIRLSYGTKNVAELAAIISAYAPESRSRNKCFFLSGRRPIPCTHLAQLTWIIPFSVITNRVPVLSVPLLLQGALRPTLES